MAGVNGLGGAVVVTTEAFEPGHELLMDLIEAGVIAGAAQGIVVVGEDQVGVGRRAFAGFWQGRAGRLRSVDGGGGCAAGEAAAESGWTPGKAGVADDERPPRRSMWLRRCVVWPGAAPAGLAPRPVSGRRAGQSAPTLVARAAAPLGREASLRGWRIDQCWA